MASEPTEEEPRKRASPPPVEFVKPEEAQGPLPPRDQPPAAWVPRPEDYQPPPTWAPPTAPRAGPSNLPTIAGLLLILSAIIGMAGSVYSAVTLPSVADYADFTQNNSPELVAALQVCGLIIIWSQAMALLGGVLAFQRMNWRLTLVCAIFSLATFGYFFFEASLVGLLGLIVTILARPYFVT